MIGCLLPITLLGCAMFDRQPPHLADLGQIDKATGRGGVVLSATVHPAVRGVDVVGRIPARSGGWKKDTIQHHTHVFALSEPGQPLTSPVRAWVTAPGYLEPEAVDGWLASLQQALADGPVTFMAHELTDDTRASGRMKAIRAAETAHGLTSAQPALIVVYAAE